MMHQHVSEPGDHLRPRSDRNLVPNGDLEKVYLRHGHKTAIHAPCGGPCQSHLAKTPPFKEPMINGTPAALHLAANEDTAVGFSNYKTPGPYGHLAFRVSLRARFCADRHQSRRPNPHNLYLRHTVPKEWKMIIE